MNSCTMSARGIATIAMALAIALLSPAVAAYADDEVSAIAAVIDTGSVPTTEASTGAAPERALVLEGDTVHIATPGTDENIAIEELAQQVGEVLGEEVTIDELTEAIETTQIAPFADDARLDTPHGELHVAPDSENTISIGVPGDHLTTETIGPATLASFEDGEVQYVLSESAGTSSAFAVINDSSAGDEFTFDIAAGGADVELELQDNGMVMIYGPDGNLVNALLPAWALDATGQPVETNYRIEGSSVVQTIELAGDELYPVVADPTAACNYSTTLCTIRFSRSETLQIAAGGSAGATVLGLGCNWVPIWQVKLACAAVAIPVFLGGAYAAYAYASGRCMGIQSQVLRGVWGIIYNCVKR